ncbi:MAG: methyltransferase family protein, partial [Glaciecola sp.]
LGFVFVIIAAGLAMQSFLFPIVAIGFILYITRFQIIPEERALLKLFSQEFAQYTKSTPRWI